MYNITFSLEQDKNEALYEQVYGHFLEKIRSGELRSGEKLPSKRSLCGHLGVSRSTVETAYGMLLAEGYVFSRPRSGYYVADFTTYGSFEGAKICLPEEPENSLKPKYDFSTSSVDTVHFPYSSWAKLNREVLYSSPELLQRGERQGDRPFREALAEFLAQYRGVQCATAQIVVGAGMEYLTALLLQLFEKDAVFGVEDPGYNSICSTIRNSGRELRFISLDDKGMDINSLQTSDVTVAYITPSHQFPLGISMPASRRSQLLRWAMEGEERYIIEDDYDSEFRYDSRPIPAMQGMDIGGRVVYIGTFSRSIAPSIRIAYMVLPPELLKRYRAMFSHSQSTVSRYEQAVMTRFISEGGYSRHLRRLGNRYAQRCRTLTAALEKIEGVSISGNGGGIHFLLTCPKFTETELVERARLAGIELRGLSAYCHEAKPRPSTLVLGYGGIETEQIEEAAELLKKAWK